MSDASSPSASPDAGLPESDFVSSFQIDGRPVRGRLARLGAGSIDPILHRHRYPPHLARILGEAVTLAALVGESLKFEGRILVQAEGDGPVSMLVGEYRTDGGVRGYARFEHERWAHLEKVNKGGRPHMPQLFGTMGRLGLILIRNTPGAHPYQGIVPLNKATLAECAEDYFRISEQVPTRVALSVAELTKTGEAPEWRGGGMLLQQIASDETRGDTAEAWDEARALFGTLTDGELADPDLSGEALLYRLFHETGVRVEAAQPVLDSCTCNKERLIHTLQSLPDDELRELVEDDGALALDCQFCARHYRIPIEQVTESAD